MTETSQNRENVSDLIGVPDGTNQWLEYFKLEWYKKIEASNPDVLDFSLKRSFETRPMSLKEYKKKRDFSKTQEPQESMKKGDAEELVYVIQRHSASRLHYDLRLEEDGVLKSWAIPKSPPEKEGIRRLAVMTEDHPLGYEEFEGIIPEGEYGAGKVETWDKGHYLLLETSSLKRIIEIKGKKLNGKYGLIKLKPKIEEDKNWLFFKLKNEK